MPNVIIMYSTDVANIVRKLPTKYRVPPSSPTDRIEYFLNKMLANNPEKLTAPQNELVMIVTALVPAPKLTRKSLYIKPNDAKLPKQQPCTEHLFKLVSLGRKID